MTAHPLEPAMNKTTEILIIGAGPAGATAAIYAARAGKATLLLEGRGATRLGIGYTIENYPGLPATDSRELLGKFLEQARGFGAESVAEEAIDFNFSGPTKYVVTRERLYEAKAVILATGRPVTRERMIPGEERLVGQGVSYCATCDGPSIAVSSSPRPAPRPRRPRRCWRWRGWAAASTGFRVPRGRRTCPII